MSSFGPYELEQTCGACPEQYDVYLAGERVGYLRLRHGYFRAECKDQTVYEADTIGDGCFDPDERDKHLQNAVLAIHEEMLKNARDCKSRANAIRSLTNSTDKRDGE